MFFWLWDWLTHRWKEIRLCEHCDNMMFWTLVLPLQIDMVSSLDESNENKNWCLCFRFSNHKFRPIIEYLLMLLTSIQDLIPTDRFVVECESWKCKISRIKLTSLFNNFIEVTLTSLFQVLSRGNKYYSIDNKNNSYDFINHTIQ